MKNQNQSKGYLIVASTEYRYYAWAINLAEQIKDYYPEAQICLVVDENYLDGREKIVDHVVLTEGSAIGHRRAKLWGMSKTPFDVTFYLDVDMECLHEDIGIVFDELEDSDLVFNVLEEKNYNIFQAVHFPGGMFTLCGGVCLYRSSNPLVMDFMKDWWEIFEKQDADQWWPENEDGQYDCVNYPRELKQWDQFTLWWLVNKVDKYKDLKVGQFKENDRWNYWSLQHRYAPMPENTVLYHKSFAADQTVYQPD